MMQGPQNSGNEQRNLLLFVLVIVGFMMAWDYFFAPEKPAAEQNAQQQSTELSHKSDVGLPSSVEPKEVHHKPLSHADSLKATARHAFQTKTVKGSVRLTGGRLDDLTLRDYTESVNDDTPVVLLSPEGTTHPYEAEFGWVSGNGAEIDVPTKTTTWTVDESEAGQLPTLKWVNPQNITFEQAYTVDDQYMFSVEAKVTNNSDKPVTLYPYGRILRSRLPETIQSTWTLHEGPIGYLDNKLEEFDYSDLEKKSDQRFKSQGGWIGMTDKYWLTALVPNQSKKQEYFFKDVKRGFEDQYQTGYYDQAITLQPGESQAYTHNLFAGPKVLDILDGYEEKFGVKHFDLAIDFGWYYFIAKPFFYTLEFFNDLFNSMGLAIILMTILLKILLLPIAHKSYRSMAMMKKFQPKIKEVQTRFKDDKMRQNQELMELYKREKINPLSGCLPMLLQIPIFFAFYKVLLVTIEMRQAPFYGWIHDLSAPDPTSLFNLFGLLPWDPPAMLQIGVWPILMGLTMLLQQKLQPTPQDPVQEKMFMIFPLFLIVMMAQFPAGLVIYWALSNILTIAQMWFIRRTVDA